MPTAPLDPPSPASRRRRRPPLWRGSPAERRSVQIGLLGTVLVHLLLLWIAPRLESRFMHGGATFQPTSTPTPTFDIELSEDLLEEPPPPQQFVEVNPDAPDNPPDQTDNFGAQNQQLAQETPDPENSGDMPATEGESEIDTTAIVSGTRSAPLPPVAAPPPQPESQDEQTENIEPAANPQLAQNPIEGYEEFQGDNPDGIGTHLAEQTDEPQSDVDERVEGVTDPSQARPEGSGIYYRPNPNRPQPRPVLAQSQIRPTIMANRVDGTSNLGVRAHNALKTTYGEYLARLIDVVDQEWNRNIRQRFERGIALPADGSQVEVTFLLDKMGKVTISKVDGAAGHLWNGVAVEAIAAPARYSEGYGKWPEDMIQVLGEQQELVFTFHY